VDGLRIVEEPVDRLGAHASIPIAFTVERRLEVTALGAGLSGLRFTDVAVDTPWVKDDDAIPDNSPASWPARFDLSDWGLLAAYDAATLVGGAVVIPSHERAGRAVLWDLRVRPEWRSRGVGTALFAQAERWARAQGCDLLEVETQNVNVAACRLYARAGCEVCGVDRDAYEAFPDEVRIDWCKALGPA
jgi:GNAT superfamily N-acetyltransferase